MEIRSKLSVKQELYVLQYDSSCRPFFAEIMAVENTYCLKETLLDSLSAVLSADQVTRKSGEEQVKALEVTEGRSSLNQRIFILSLIMFHKIRVP